MILAILWFLILGLPAALLLDPDATPRRLLGSAYLLGTGIVSLILLAFSIAGVTWTLVRITIAALCFCVATAALGRRRKDANTTGEGARRHTEARTPALLVDAATLLLVIAHGAFATAARVGVWDFWAIFGLKARVFFERGAIDWAFLENVDHAFAHPDYPPLLSFDYVFVALQDGVWSDRWMGILTTLFAAALLLIVRDCLAEELPPLLAALGTLGIASIALTQWIGMGEAPMIAFGTAALLFLRRGSVPMGAVLLGFATMAKNEGVALFVAIAIAMALTGRRKDILRLWPAAAIATPWLVLRAMHALPTDLARGSVIERASNQWWEVLRGLATTSPGRPVFWIGVAATLILFAKWLRTEKFVLTAVLLQFLFYVAAYIVTPNDVQWHIVNSWLRILDHIAVPLGLMALLVSGRFFATTGGILWTLVVDGGTNDRIELRKPWN